MAAGMMIQNQGGEIVFTDYWASAQAARGLFFVSINAGTVRLLMPRSQEDALPEMKTATQVVLTRGLYENREAVEVMFDDDSVSPFSLWLDVRQFDHLWLAAEDNRKLPFLVYTESGKVLSLTCELRRTTKLPSLKS